MSLLLSLVVLSLYWLLASVLLNQEGGKEAELWRRVAQIRIRAAARRRGRSAAPRAYVYLYLSLSLSLSIYIYICIYTHVDRLGYMFSLSLSIYIYIYTHMCVYIYIYIRIHMYIYIYACIPTYVFVCVYMHVYIYIYIYVYTYTCWPFRLRLGTCSSRRLRRGKVYVSPSHRRCTLKGVPRKGYFWVTQKWWLKSDVLVILLLEPLLAYPFCGTVDMLTAARSEVASAGLHS